MQIIQTEESPRKVRIICDSQPALLCSANLQPAITLKSIDKSDIVNLLAALHDDGHKMTFTCCPSHCQVVGNVVADEQALIGAAANQEDVRHNYDSAKATIRRATSGEISYERICWVCGMKGKNLDSREKSKLSRKEQTTIGRLRSGHHPEHKYWLHKIGCAVDTIC